jgi:micrococcal nuclease
MKALRIALVIFAVWVSPLFAGNDPGIPANHAGGALFGKQYLYENIVVTKVIDGDTVQLENGERVRLLGIDTPEVYQSKESQEKARRKGTDVKAIRVLGKQASVFTKQLMEGKRVRLIFDIEKKDKYDRLLAYVFIDQPAAVDITASEGYYFIYDGKMTSLFCNATIIKSGYAHPLSIPPNLMYADVFRTLHREAREHKRGLWK